LKDAWDLEPVEYLFAALFVFDNACIPEHRKVFGDGREVCIDGPDKFAHAGIMDFQSLSGKWEDPLRFPCFERGLC
jgi:hypothetical protein